VSAVLNSPERLGARQDEADASCDRAQLRAQSQPDLLKLTASLLSPIFGPLLSLDTHALRVDISLQRIRQLYTAVYEGPAQGSQGSKTGLLAKTGACNLFHLIPFVQDGSGIPHHGQLSKPFPWC
jgi:hypothetical protein